MGEVRFEQVVMRRVRHLRERRGLSQQRLADRLAELGVPIERSQLARLERGERGVGVDELMALAFALDTAPAYLLLDLEADERTALVPGVAISPADARGWIRGQRPLPQQDPRGYLAALPRDQVEAIWEAWRAQAPTPAGDSEGNDAWRRAMDEKARPDEREES